MTTKLAARAAGRLAAGFLVCSALIAVVTDKAVAQTHEAIIEKCRETVGRPIVQACMAGSRDSGMLEKCRAQATPKVRGCVMAAEQKMAAGKAAPSAPKGDQPSLAQVALGAIRAIFVKPPRTIADITAILDQEKPDPGKIAKARAAADAQPDGKLSGEKLVQFYYDRAAARAFLGRDRDALADAQQSLQIAQKSSVPVRQINRIRQMLGIQYLSVSEPKQAVEVLKATVASADAAPNNRGAMINAARIIAQTYLAIGEVEQADAFAQKVVGRVQEARGSPHPNWRDAYRRYGNSWEADSDEARALVFEARGQYREAIEAYKRAEAFRKATVKDIPLFEYPVPVTQVEISAWHSVRAQARVLSRQARYAEAEAESRRALLGALKSVGKYYSQMPYFVMGLASILVDQGRYDEAEKLARSALEIRTSMGAAEDSQLTVGVLSQLASILTLERKHDDAAPIYAQIEKAAANWEPKRRDAVLVNGARVSALYAAGRIEDGIVLAQTMVSRQQARKTSEADFELASARGRLAIGYALARRDDDAIREFKVALPAMMATAHENADDEDTATVATRSRLLQSVAESYMAVMARRGANDAAGETFALADAVRGRSVQQALAASSARMTVKDPALAEMVRGEQDLTKQVNAQLGTLNNVLSLPSSERDDNTVRALNATIIKLRSDRDKMRGEITRRFPSYADLVDPKPPTVDQIKAALKPGEALLSFYFGERGSFVWAVPKDGAMAFASIPATAADIEAKVKKLREALEPQAAMISDIPAFDLTLAYQLYGLLLKPVESGWKSAGSLVVVTNGALGLLPLSLLPTAPTELKSGGVPFAAYRDVPWLARSHAVTMVPSAAALRTLRALPPGAPSRSALVAFGDPYFSKEEADAAEKETVIASADGGANVTRGVPLLRRSSPKTEGVNSADLALLPRLPDTADELRSIAAALQADPAKVLYLGKAANEKNVKTLDLAKTKVVAFATHGLVPGELDGLTQPALALSAPQVADVDGDGLLTMEEILSLKLDADWVVLSACNTGAGAGAGAEAASGLGRAFFYAGTRAILVTNWSVHSQSARELVSDLFRRQADGQTGRGEALRQAMLALIDGKGFANDKGDTVFAYAHPLFWAPYTIIGDGGK
ncbi:MAG: CHAT domain-containing protein [Proteobacteria bacterium]|nr:CHAT domain-containing protein [Pseudomonadota bacterium]